MLPTLLFELFTISADIIIFIFVGYYLWRFRAKEKEIEKRESKIDTEYHQVVDTALTRERKILDDATSTADKIIADAQYVSQTSQGLVDQTLKAMVADIHKEAIATAQEFARDYEASLKQLTDQSLNDFSGIVRGLQTDLAQQIKQVHETMLPGLEKELADYKQARIQQTEQMIVSIVQKVSQEVLNKSISIEDHEKLLMDAIEEAKKGGVFG